MTKEDTVILNGVTAEPTEWKRPYKTKPRSKTRQIVDAMQPGETLRIIHTDVSCNFGHDGSCTLRTIIKNKVKEGWKIKHYHEVQYIAVVKRIK